MTHFSEQSQPLSIHEIAPATHEELFQAVDGLNEVIAVRLPAITSTNDYKCSLQGCGELIAEIARRLGSQATLVVLGEIVDLVRVLENLEPSTCLLYTSPSPRDGLLSRMPSSA